MGCDFIGGGMGEKKNFQKCGKIGTCGKINGGGGLMFLVSDFVF